MTSYFPSITDTLYTQYSQKCQKQLAQYLQNANNDDETNEITSSPYLFQYCILEPFMKKQYQGMNVEKILAENSSSSTGNNHYSTQSQPGNDTSTPSMQKLEEAVFNGEYEFGELLKYDKRSLSHVQYVNSYCGDNYVDQYLNNNCHVKALAGENCEEIQREASDCITNLACDRIRDSLIDCHGDLKKFDRASIVHLMLDTKDIQYGSMQENHCGIVLKDMLHCIDKYTMLGALLKPDRRMGSMRYAPLDEETYRTYKQFARREAKRRRDEMDNYV